jgi:hypothetical protein
MPLNKSLLRLLFVSQALLHTSPERLPDLRIQDNDVRVQSRPKRIPIAFHLPYEIGRYPQFRLNLRSMASCHTDSPHFYLDFQRRQAEKYAVRHFGFLLNGVLALEVVMGQKFYDRIRQELEILEKEKTMKVLDRKSVV